MPGEPDQAADQESNPGLELIERWEHETAMSELFAKACDQSGQDVEYRQAANEIDRQHRLWRKALRQRRVHILPCRFELLCQPVQKDSSGEIPCNTAKRCEEYIRKRSNTDGDQPEFEIVFDFAKA